MKYVSVTIRDTLLTVGIWMLVPVGDGQKRVSDDVLNLPKFRSWRGCSDLPSKAIFYGRRIWGIWELDLGIWGPQIQYAYFMG